jgi:hypothetical protein
MRTNRGVLAGVLLMGFLAAPPANAQTASRLGPSITAISAFVKGSAVAYDPKNSKYLVVSAYGDLNGRFVSADGELLGAPFTIQVGAVGFAHFPGVAYSPDANGGAGGFLVAWHQSVAVGAVVYARTVSTTGALGPATQLSADGSWWEAIVDVAYSTGSQEFLVVWQAAGIRAQRVSTAGGPLGANILVTGTNYHRDPSVAYNPVANEFMVVYAGDDGVSPFVGARRVAAGSGALVGTQTLLSRAVGTYITEVAYNSSSNTYLAAWYQGGTYGRILDAAGTATTGVLLLATRFSAYDALGIDYNAASGTYMMVSHDTASLQDGAVELSAGAVPGVGFVATDAPTTKGNYYPKIAARAGKAEWLMSTATAFAATTVQRVQSTASGGGTPPPSPPPTPPPSIPSSSSTQAKGDFSGDGKADIVWQRDDGHLSIWGMNGTTATFGQPLNPGFVDPAWRIMATGDFNGDGKADLVWQSATGWLSVWFMNGTNMASSAHLNPVSVDANWRIVGSGDFNGDGKADLVWQHTDGWLAVWYMDGATMVSSHYLNPNQIANTDWRVMGVGDFNRDGRPDLVWQHTNGSLWVWYMNGPNVLGSAVPNPGQVENTGWRIRAVVDLNGDGQADLIWQNMAEGWVCAWFMNGVTAMNGVFLTPANVSGGWKIVGPR